MLPEYDYFIAEDTDGRFIVCRQVTSTTTTLDWTGWKVTGSFLTKQEAKDDIANDGGSTE